MTKELKPNKYGFYMDVPGASRKGHHYRICYDAWNNMQKRVLCSKLKDISYNNCSIDIYNKSVHLSMYSTELEAHQVAVAKRKEF